MTYVLDAGPCLNFFATNNQNILVRVVGKGFRVPETVRAEVARRSRDQRDARFARAWNVWMRLESNGWIEVLSDSSTPSLLAAAKAVLTGASFPERLTRSKDLGETMVVIHAVEISMRGNDVVVIIDDAEGRVLASTQTRRLERLSLLRREQGGAPIGRVTLMSTGSVLAEAARTGVIADRAQMKSVYAQLKQCDDGLLPIERTDLLDPALWPAS